MCQLSVVIPAFNEADLIAETIQQSCAYLRQNFSDSELLIVDDGSTDATCRIVEDQIASFGDDLPVRLISNGRNRGKGFSIKNGVEHARGKQILFYDADLPYDLNSIRAAVDGLEGGFDVVVGSRVLAGAMIDVNVPAIRKLASKIYRAIVHRLIDLDVEDTQCGFKAFRIEAARDIFSQVTIPGFGFDIEALALAQHKGYTILSIPVKMLKIRHASRIKLARDAFKMFGDILRVAWRARARKNPAAERVG
jgi:dolichyl-phosphate beta-glucosyltransferase